MKVTPETVVLINCGCEGIQKLARAVRARKVYTMVIPYSAPAERVGAEKPAGLLLVSDGPCARLDEAEKKFSALGVPMLEITDPENAVEAAVDFCFKKCGCSGNWDLDKFIDEAVADIRAQVGDGRVVLGLSGGVDSSVVAALIHKAIGDRLTCVFVDHGLLRKN